jgi:hypothetical protein
MAMPLFLCLLFVIDSNLGEETPFLLNHFSIAGELF